MSFIVYCHTNKFNGKRYIGWTKYTMLERWKDHCNCALGRHKQLLMSHAIRKYGTSDDVWTHEILETMSTIEGAKRAEILWIAHFNTNACNGGIGYNMTDGGDGHCGFKHSAKQNEAQRKRLTDFNVRKNLSDKLKMISKKKGCIQFTLDGKAEIARYMSIREATKITGVGNITRCCQGWCGSAGGFVWEFVK